MRVSLGNAIGPFGAVALVVSFSESADVIRPVLEKGMKPSETPLDRSQGRARDTLDVIGLAVDRDQYRDRVTESIVAQSQNSDGRFRHRRFERGSSNLSA